MGSTVTTGKMATAFRMSQGRVCFVLFERLHETNVYPHTPTWQCIFIGTAPAAIRRIFAWASECEGGMLRGRDGHIKPENYIAAWLRELANPVIMPDRRIRLYAGTSFSAPLPVDNEVFLARMEAHGRDDFAKLIRDGNVAELSLHAHADILIEMFGQDRNRKPALAPWRMLSGHDRPHDPQRDPGLGYAPQPIAPDLAPIPPMIRINEHERMLRNEDGVWVNEGWAYGVIGRRITEMSEIEIETPGYYRKAIPRLREAVENAPWPPDGTFVRLDRSACHTRHDLEQFDYTATRNSIEIPTGKCTLPWSKEIGDAVAYFPSVAVSWDIPRTT
jgi:hypothetical protein